MKKQLIKEAFRLQQIAGLRPINEIGDYNTLDTLGAYEDENGKTVVSDLIKNEKFIEDKLRKAGISSSKEYDQDVHGQKIVIFTIEAEGMSRSMQKEDVGQPSDELRQLVSKSVKPEFHDRIGNSYEGVAKFLSAKVQSAKMQGASKDVYAKLINQLVQAKGVENYQDILKKYRVQNLDMLGDMANKQPSSAASILKDLDSLTQGLQKETSLSEQEDPGFEALIDDLILKIAQNYAEEGEDVEDYMGVAAEDAVELIRRKYRV